eukprot:982814-Pelagomonas_calceolata.AAC.3
MQHASSKLRVCGRLHLGGFFLDSVAAGSMLILWPGMCAAAPWHGSPSRLLLRWERYAPHKHNKHVHVTRTVGFPSKRVFNNQFWTAYYAYC